MSTNKKLIQELISKGNLSKALDQFELLSNELDDDLQNHVILLKARFNRLHRDEGLGIVNFDNASQTRNRLTYAVLSLLDEVDDSSVEISIDNQEIIQDSSKTILFVAANPKDSKALRIGKEYSKIVGSLGWGDKSESFNMEQIWAADIKDLRRAMLKHSPHIVHFSGHGSKEGGILLEDEEGFGRAVSIEGLGKLFGFFKNSTKCVVLNSCYSEPQANEISQYISIVIGTKVEIPDETSIAFSEAFYEALGIGHSIQKAFKFACTNIENEGLDGHNIPVIIENQSQ